MTSLCNVADCLASYEKYREINFMMRLGPTLMGVKPMHILCFRKDFKFVDRLLADLEMLFASHESIRYRLVYSRNNSIKVIVYHLETMTRLLEDQRVLRFLTSRGFSAEMTAEDYMDHLHHCLIDNRLPEEYGVFFGYPLKDVMGFIGHPSLKHVKTTAWKVYGDPTLSDRLFDQFQRAEEKILRLCQTLPLHAVVAQLHLQEAS
jgi:hypothetical protein